MSVCEFYVLRVLVKIFFFYSFLLEERDKTECQLATSELFAHMCL